MAFLGTLILKNAQFQNQSKLWHLESVPKSIAKAIPCICRRTFGNLSAEDLSPVDFNILR